MALSMRTVIFSLVVLVALLTIPVMIGVYVCRDAKTPGNKRDGVEMPSAPPQRQQDKFLSKIKPGAGKRGAAGTVIRCENRGNANVGAADVTGPALRFLFRND